jgi:glycogen operon protein
VSYLDKHNEANGEINRDGAADNFSQNCGAEGETTDIEIESTRNGQIKNFLLSLLISRGVPMLLGGDEFRRTQRGNNNAYCQDNEISWCDWSRLARHQEIYRFTRGMIAFRREHPILSKEHFYTDDEIQWFSPSGDLPRWSDPQAKQLACLIHEGEQDALYLMFNAGVEPLEFRLPAMPSAVRWHRAVDTSREAPQDLFVMGEEPLHADPSSYRLGPRASAILLTSRTNHTPQGVKSC